MPSSRRPPPSQDAAARSIWFAGAGFAVMLAGVGAWLLWPREDKLAAVSELQRQVLAAGGTPGRSDINRLIQLIDRMDRREVWAAYRAAGAEWKRIKQEAMDAYFAAPKPDRPALLDAQIERLVARSRWPSPSAPPPRGAGAREDRGRTRGRAEPTGTRRTLRRGNRSPGRCPWHHIARLPLAFQPGYPEARWDRPCPPRGMAGRAKPAVARADVFFLCSA